MTADLYLIAHKVRGAPAFDVAEQLVCPECEGNGVLEAEGTFEAEDCHECDSTGYWWIIPTSGHRAYPSDYAPLANFYSPMGERILDVLALPTESLPDHYTTRAAPRIDLATALGLRKPAAPALPPLPRRL